MAACNDTGHALVQSIVDELVKEFYGIDCQHTAHDQCGCEQESEKDTESERIHMAIKLYNERTWLA